MHTPPRRFVRLGPMGERLVSDDIIGLDVWFKTNGRWVKRSVTSVANSGKSIGVDLPAAGNRLNVSRNIRIQPSIDKLMLEGLVIPCRPTTNQYFIHKFINTFNLFCFIYFINMTEYIEIKQSFPPGSTL